MDKVWDYIIDALIATLIIFFAVAIYFSLRTETVMKSIGKSVTEEFMTDVKKNGCIYAADYEEYIGELFFTGSLYDIEFEHVHSVVEPEYRLRTIEEIIEAQNAAYTGPNNYHYRDVETEYPEVIDPINSGNLNTETNESVLAKAVNKPASSTHVHTDACYVGHRHTGSCFSMPLSFTLSSRNTSSGTTEMVSVICGYCKKPILSLTRVDPDYGNWSMQVRTYNNPTQYYRFEMPDERGNFNYYAEQLTRLWGILTPYVENEKIDSWDGYYGNSKTGFVPAANNNIELPILGMVRNCVYCAGKPRDIYYTGAYNYSDSTWTYIFSSNNNNQKLIEVTYTYLSWESRAVYSIKLYKNGVLVGTLTDSSIYPFITDIISRTNLSMDKPEDTGILGKDDPLFQYSFLGDTVSSITPASQSTCGLIGDDSLDCNKLVVSIIATHPVQTVATGDPLITTAIATYKDGSTRTIVCSTSFSTATTTKNQVVALTYDYYVDGTAYHTQCTITVTVVPRIKTCSNGHTYNLKEDGSDPGCPYCREWIMNLRVLYPTTSTMTITIGTTLPDNGVTLHATYFDGHTETIASGYIDNLDSQYLGTQRVTIGYKGKTVQLMITTVRARMICDICGYEYELYPDDTNPGCPRCIQKTPVFTGNVLRYEEAVYTEEILNRLYTDGVYLFNLDDTFTIHLNNKSSNIARGFLNKLFPSLSDRWFSLSESEKIGIR